MNELSTPPRPTLLVIASTYPRWKDDPEPAFVHELARRLTGRFKVIALCPHASGAQVSEVLDGVMVVRYRYAPASLETLVNDGGIISNLRQKPWKWLLLPGFVTALAWHTWRLISTLRPDIIHAHWLLPQGLVVALLGLFNRRMPPFVVTSHGADLFALRASPLQALKRFVIRRAVAVTVVSAAMRNELTRIGVAAHKINVQPMGVDLTDRFTPDHSVRSRHEILFVGRLVEKKGLRHLIDAIPEVLQVYPAAFLTVIGFGPELAERHAQVARLRLQDKVRFIGAVPQGELPALYRRAAVFVAPFVRASSGDQEGLGLVSVEALGCGCPIVLGEVPAVREVFPQNRAVQLTPPGDAALLAKAIIGVLASTEALAASVADARSVIMQSLDWKVVTSCYADVLSAPLSLSQRL